jgi:hypothetical protein
MGDSRRQDNRDNTLSGVLAVSLSRGAGSVGVHRGVECGWLRLQVGVWGMRWFLVPMFNEYLRAAPCFENGLSVM